MFTMIDRLTANIHISWKLLIAPAIAIALLSIMAPLALKSLGDQSRMLDQLTTTEVDKAMTVAGLARAIPEASNDVNRLIALLSNSDDAAASKRLTASLDAKLTDAAALVEHLGKSKLTAEEKRLVDELGGALKAYGTTSRQAANMATADVATAFVMSTNGQRHYATLLGKLDALQALERSRAQSDHAASVSLSQTARTGFIALFAVAVAVASLVSIAIGRAVGSSIKRLTGSMLKLADGDVGVEVDGKARKDEVGDMARALEVFRANLVRETELREQTERERTEREAERERQRAAEEQHRAEQEETRARHTAEQEARAKRMAELAGNFDRQVQKALQGVAAAGKEMETMAAGMTATAQGTSEKTTIVAAAIEEAASNVETVATAAEELSASVAEISRQVGQSTRISERAVSEVERTNKSVRGLSEAAQQIGQVVDLINNIAGQTNLLALNATIEAARAGEAGKGFAVVASEVKTLANQTAKATDEIGTQIARMRQVTDEVVEAIRGIGATIAEISEIATSIASAIEEQGAATQEIARNVQQASVGTQEVSTRVGEVAAATRETGTAAARVEGAAEELFKQSDGLRRDVDRFLEAIKMA
jgi:methyl-accepting chemotaxis protein